MASADVGSCECECARCDQGYHCGRTDEGCYYHDPDKEPDEDEDDEGGEW